MAVKIFFNRDTTATFYCQCSVDYTAAATYYTVPAGKYFSTVSQLAANAMAAADMVANGQSFANNYGKCSNGCNVCFGLNRKCINDVCETGYKALVSSVQQGDGTWLCTFHYVFSDGSYSANFTETHADSSCDFL